MNKKQNTHIIKKNPKIFIIIKELVTKIFLISNKIKVKHKVLQI